MKERSETLLLHNNLTEVCMAFELVGSAFVCYEVLALRALGVADSRTTHTAPIAARSQNEYRYDRYSITGIGSTVVSGSTSNVK